MSKSTIEWTQHTWNPIVSGCSIISEGCTNCYAMQMANRLEAMGQEKYKGLTRKTQKGKILWNGNINIDMNDKALYEPLQRKKPTMYFVNSMTDLFHENVPFEAIDKIMAVIALCPQHTFQLLTKRADRMKEYFHNRSSYFNQDIEDFILQIVRKDDIIFKNNENNKWTNLFKQHTDEGEYKAYCVVSNEPLPNLWLGVSIENQEQADKRIPYLLATPAKVRFLSVEPLLGTIDFSVKKYTQNFGFQRNVKITGNLLTGDDCLRGGFRSKNSYDGFMHMTTKEEFADIGFPKPQLYAKIDWVIVGGESGHHARPMHPDWVRSIKNQCQEADVPFFFKQWGEWLPVEKINGSWYNNGGAPTFTLGYLADQYNFDENNYAAKVGKKLSGNLLDGVQYQEYPKQ